MRIRAFIGSFLCTLALVTSASAQGTYLDQNEIGFSGFAAHAFSSGGDLTGGGMSFQLEGTFETGLTMIADGDFNRGFIAPFVGVYRHRETDGGRVVAGCTGALEIHDDITLLNFQVVAGHDYRTSSGFSIQPYFGPSLIVPIGGELSGLAQTDFGLGGGLAVYNKSNGFVPALDISWGYMAESKVVSMTIGFSVSIVTLLQS